MKNEISVKNFLTILKDSIWETLTDGSYAKYYGNIENLLFGLDEKICLTDLSSLDGLTDSEHFDIFLRSSSPEELDKRFYAIYFELRTWKRRLVSEKISVLNNKKIKAGEIIVGMILAVTCILGILLIYASFGEENLWSKVVSAVLTVLDAVLGVAFFLYEFCNDKKQIKVIEKAEQEKESVNHNEFIGLKIGKQINKNKGHVVNGNKIVRTKEISGSEEWNENSKE